MFNKILIIIFLCLINSDTFAENNRIIIASTTSTNDTGLLDYINNEFEKKFNFKIHVLSLGTGQAITLAKNGDADILLVHDTSSELEFIKNGYVISKIEDTLFSIMKADNSFIIFSDADKLEPDPDKDFPFGFNQYFFLYIYRNLSSSFVKKLIKNDL